MFPISTESPLEAIELVVTDHENAVVYGDPDTVLHEGPVRLLVNGWLELPSGRLLSPQAVHHVDPRPAG